MSDERRRLHGYEHSGADLPPIAAVLTEADAIVRETFAPVVRPTAFWNRTAPPVDGTERRFWRGVAYGAVFGLALWVAALFALWVVLRWL